MTTTQDPLWKVKAITGYSGEGITVAKLEVSTQAQTVESIRRKVEAMPDLLRACQAALEYIKDDLEQSGGCDHSVGICACREIHLAEQLQAAISKSS